jgi:hypothetical protein
MRARGNEVTDKVCYSNVHLLNGRTLILIIDEEGIWIDGSSSQAPN